MKRSDMLKLIANQLDLLNGRFHGLRVNFTEQEIKNAEVILTTIEQAGMKPPWNNAEFQKQARTLIEPEGYGWEPEKTCEIPEFTFKCLDCECEETPEQREARLIEEGKRSGAV